MWPYVRKQLVLTFIVLFGVSIISFVSMRLIPGGPIEAMVLEGGAQVSGEQIEELRERHGLNDPIHVQYGNYIINAVRGDLGRSLRTNIPVLDMIKDNLPFSVRLAVMALIVAVFAGIFLGFIAAFFHRTVIDSASMALAMLGWSMPSFWVGIILILVFSITLGWFPLTGPESLKRLILPAIALGMGTAGLTARLLRTSILEVLGFDYVRTARAKGLSEFIVMMLHVGRNALIPVVTMIGLQFGRLLGGTIIIETVFIRRGMGTMLVQAIIDRDFPVVQSGVLVLAIIFIVANRLVDISYAFIDPRIRQE